MGRRDNDHRRRFDETGGLDRLIDALERDDRAEIARLRAELTSHEEHSLLELEHDAEEAARERATRETASCERTLDRVRNVFQAVLLDKLLRGQPGGTSDRRERRRL